MADYRAVPGQLPVSSTRENGQDFDRRFHDQEKGLVDNGAAAQMPTSAGYGSLKGLPYMAGIGYTRAGEKTSFHPHSASKRFTQTRFPALQSLRSLKSPFGGRYGWVMAAFTTIVLFFALRLLFTLDIVGAAPFSNVTHSNFTRPTASDYWVANIQRRGTVPFNANPGGYRVFRNVQDFGAAGNGVADDTDAINRAISEGSRCGRGCDSSTVTPVLVYFPPGTYLVSRPIIQLYYTQFVGDARSPPTLKASPSFQGIGVIDSDPYDERGQNWYTNQNNFFRQIRNFIIDLTALPPTTGTGIHWQVAQATSLQNIRFEMHRGGNDNRQQGIFMDNGSGGFMTDLTFNGGRYGAFFGNQQFTTRNLVFNDCQTAIFMNWNWLWTFKSLKINRCDVGIDMANGGEVQTVGSVLVQDSQITNTRVGIYTAFGRNPDTPYTNGTLVIDNVDFTGTGTAVEDPARGAVLGGNARISSWAQGKRYTATSSDSSITGSRIREPLPAASKPGSLLNGAGVIYERSKPQYEQYPASAFVSVKANGAKGDGRTDDTAAIQAVLNRVAGNSNQIVYFDHGAYVVSSTIRVPKNIKITGEIWPLILASGSAFQDESNPRPVFQVGQPGDVGDVEMSDLMFTTAGPQRGAIMMEWNIKGSAQGSAGMWDVHWRIGGAAGTQLQSDRCRKDPGVIAPAKPECVAAFMLLHVTRQSSIYLENTWFWVADHELDLSDHNQINVFNGRGVLVESQGPVWMYGTSSEHHQLYNYQIANARDVYMAAIQTETPYYQANPNALQPFRLNSAYFDPTFSNCRTDNCRKAWGLRVVDSSGVTVMGGGLYSFFENWGQTCLATESCQENMVSIERSQVRLFGLSTKASTNMVTTLGGTVPQADNRNNFCSTLAFFEQRS